MLLKLDKIALVSLPIFVLLGTLAIAEDETFDVSMDVGNANPIIDTIESIPAQDPTSGTTTTVEFDVLVYDANGADDITGLTANFTKSGEETRSDPTCVDNGDYNSTTANFTCSIDMQFYDANGEWNVTVEATDSQSATGSDDTTYFTYNSLYAFDISPSSIGFGTLNLGDTNKGATDDPMVLTNKGNMDLSGNIDVKALDLVGETTATEYIGAGQFSVNVVDASEGDTLINNTAVTVTGTSLDRGASSTDDLYYYCEEVPSTGLSTQTYSSTALGSWTIIGSA